MNHVRTRYLRFFSPCSSVLAALVVALLPVIATANPKIATHAVSPITQKGYPKLYAAWGDAGVKQINALMPLAAQKAAA